MPLAAPIGSGLGVQNPGNLRILRERITEVPMIVDAGVGTASDAAVAMELGADGVLMNTPSPRRKTRSSWPKPCARRHRRPQILPRGPHGQTLYAPLPARSPAFVR